MNTRASSLFTASYQIESADRVALVSALDRTVGLRIGLGFAGWFGLVTLAFWLSGNTQDDLLFTIDALLRGRAPVWLYALLLLPPTLAALPPLLAGTFAGLAVRGRTGDRDIYLDFTADGIEGSGRGIYSRIAWERVTRLIETPEHLFIVVSGHDPLILPRRALRDGQHYANLLGFIRARTGLRSRG